MQSSIGETELRRSDEQCARLHQITHRLERHQFPPPDKGIPTNGLYFMFETGETAHAGERIVRIGSHTGIGNLAARLREHITLNKDRSIFRKNIGRALLSKDHDPFLEVWNLDLTKRMDRQRHRHLVDRAKQARIERAVSDYIRYHVSFSVIPARSEDIALGLERLCIATVSLCGSCRASSSWLGNFSPKPKIRASGLWQEQHLYGEPVSVEALCTIEELSHTLTKALDSDRAVPKQDSP